MRLVSTLAFAAVLLPLSPTTALAREPRTLRLRFPRVAVAPGTNPEACVAVRVPSSTPFEVATIEIRHRGLKRPVAVQHFLVYAYTGEQLDAFPERVTAAIPSRGCLELGPADRDRRQLIASGTAPRSRSTVIPGGALRLSPVSSDAGGAPAGLGFVLDGEWINPGTRARTVSAVVLLRRASAKQAVRVALPFTDRAAEAALLVPPGDVTSSEVLPDGRSAAWGPGLPEGPATDVCVLMVTGQMHKRGRFFGVDLIGPDGGVLNPAGGVANPFEPGRQHLFGGFDWTDMGSRIRPFRVGAGQALHYACWADNGSARSGRLGCEETANVVPGAVGQPAKPCLADSDCPPTDGAYPGRSFTGKCGPANLVGGPGIDDEICRLDGMYVPADQAPGCGPP